MSGLLCLLFGHKPERFDRVGLDGIEYDTEELRALMKKLGRPERRAVTFVDYYRCLRCGSRRQEQTGFPPTSWWQP